MKHKTVSIIGLGYIGLPTAAAIAAHQVKVIGVDVNQRAVDTINRGEIHIIEPELDGAVHAAVTRGFLRATTRPEAADVFIIAVPTPFSGGHTGSHKPDLSYVQAASESIAPVLKKGDLIILESTSPVGTTEQMVGWLSRVRPDLTFPLQHGESSDIRVAYCPERVLPGQVLRELVQNDRVIGGLTPRCADAARQLYQVFVRGECVTTTTRTAELCKLTENSFRDVNIAFANELSLVCDELGINVWELISLANRHPRVKILQPGPGVGGHCIAVDPWFIVDSAPDTARLIRTAREVNDSKPGHVVRTVQQRARGFDNPCIACLGLTFKANIDDMRESPSLAIVEELAAQRGFELLVVEPHARALPETLKRHTNARLVDLRSALDAADIVVGLVDHTIFKELDRTLLAGKVVVDTRGMWR